MRTILCLGANLTEPIYQIERAKELLTDPKAGLPTGSGTKGKTLRILRESIIRQTTPYGLTNQPAFFNQVIEIETSLEPPLLLLRLKKIEETMGRSPSIKWGPRLIDIDIIFMERMIMDEPDLTIPHRDIENRLFLLELLMELIPDFEHPVLCLSIRQLFALRKAGKGVMVSGDR